MRSRPNIIPTFIAIVSVSAALWLAPSSAAQSSSFRNAPQTAAEMKNPYTGASAAAAGKEAVCAGLRAVSRGKPAGNRTGACARLSHGEKRKTWGAILVHQQRKAGIGHALVVKPVTTAALADRNLPGVAGHHEDRSAVSVAPSEIIHHGGTEDTEVLIFVEFRRDLRCRRGEFSLGAAWDLSVVTVAMTQNPL